MAQAPSAPAAPWYRDLTSYHWFVFMVASLAWLFDCLDQQLFILARNKAMESLIPAGLDPKLYGGYATSIFVAGWALGGLIFGSLGDRYGRAKMLTLTVLIYSICTGLSAFSKGWIDFAVYRFLTGLGVGGVFGLAVALVADTLPDRSRTGALGMLQALSAVGNVAAGLISMYIGSLEARGVVHHVRAVLGGVVSLEVAELDRDELGALLAVHGAHLAVAAGARHVVRGRRGQHVAIARLHRAHALGRALAEDLEDGGAAARDGDGRRALLLRQLDGHFHLVEARAVL